MVYYRHDELDTTFAALSDPTRRAILARLAEQDGMSVSEIAKPFPVSLPAVMKHLDVLADAKLIRRSKTGRVVSCELTAAPMEDAMLWLNRYAQFWSKQLDRLAAFVEEDFMSVARADAVARPSLTLKRRLNAPAEKVYAAWTDPQKIVKWFGPDFGPVTKAETDLRVGGAYTIAFSTEDGEHHQVGGVYREVVPNERLVFTWAWHTMKERESLVTITIKRDGDGSILTLLHEKFFDEAAREGHRRGWSGSLDKLERLFA